MAKGQKRSNKEVKKPKQVKAKPASGASSNLTSRLEPTGQSKGRKF
jgi:hypothetical protein